MPDLESVSSRPALDADGGSSGSAPVSGGSAGKAQAGGAAGALEGTAGADPAGGTGSEPPPPPPPCTDEVLGEDESDVDCGGASECDRCETGRQCTAGTDCVSGVCADDECVEPSCSDGEQNQDETGEDCGGTCAPDSVCALGDGCAIDEDCETGHCSAEGVCVGHCESGDLDGDETDVDCGGSCGPCAADASCEVPTDCASGICTDGICVGPSCTDQSLNQDESAVDCGGVCGATCALGASCDSPSDCVSYVCAEDECATDIEVPVEAVIDDLEDGNLILPGTGGRVGSWYVFGDGSGTATHDCARIPSPRGTSVFSIRTRGSANTKWGAGIGFDLNNPGSNQSTKLPYDASAYTGITFWARAESPVTVQVVFPDRNTDAAGGICTTCDHHWLKPLSIDTEWRRYFVRFPELLLEGGGVPVPTEPDATGIVSIQFRTAANTTYEYWIDDIAFAE